MARPEVLAIDGAAPEPAAIRAAVAAWRRGELVAFPTETVYGLGAPALDAEAVARIFAAKGRPATNPVIVHVLDVAGAESLAEPFPDLARTLAARFWPGPLTIVVPRSSVVPDIVTAGGDTVALRAPSHPVARALIAALGAPIAAPSANRSTEVSPTLAAHVVRSLGDRVALVLDGGPTAVGLESTVVDATGARARVLRPGSITRDRLAAVVPLDDEPARSTGPARSPGQMDRHYAPRARVVVVAPDDVDAALAREASAGARVRSLELGDDPVAYGAALYAALHELDDTADVIVVARPPEGDAWEAIRDRLRRAGA